MVWLIAATKADIEELKPVSGKFKDGYLNSFQDVIYSIIYFIIFVFIICAGLFCVESN
jgi:hypothetical protein